MDPRDHLLGLVQQLYAAPGTTEGWHTFLASLCTTLNGSGASFISHDLMAHRGSVTVTARMDPEVFCLYNQHWSKLDPWMYSPRLSQVLHGRAVAVGDELVAHADFRRTAYYADFARRFDMVRMVGGAVETGPAALSVVSINGSEQREPFGERELALFELLGPHIRRALQLHRRLMAAAAASANFASVIDTSPQAVFLLDAAGQISFMNAAASRLTATRDGLTVQQRELWASRPADTTRLRAVIASTITTADGDGIGPGGNVVLGRPSGQRSLVVSVCPLSRQQPLFPGVESASAVVFVTDPDRIEVPDEGVLGALFGLTKAEARLTRLLAQGATLLEAATRLGVRHETVRSRVKSIFEKTNTHRQADLIRLVLNGAPRM